MRATAKQVQEMNANVKYRLLVETAASEVNAEITPGFAVHLENFEGPFDLLLQLLYSRP
jgi:hypothetical protein